MRRRRQDVGSSPEEGELSPALTSLSIAAVSAARGRCSLQLGALKGRREAADLEAEHREEGKLMIVAIGDSKE